MISVFDHPWYGALFGDDAAAALWSAGAQRRHYLAFEAAYSRALGSAGLVGVDAAERAARAIADNPPDDATLARGTARDGLPVPALVAALRDAAGADAGAVHTGTTSQDVLDTALALTLRDQSDLLATRLGALQDRFAALSARFGSATLMGRTRMQAALPVTAAHRIDSWARPLADHAARLAALRPQVELVQLAGPVGTGDSMDGHAPRMARQIAAELGLHVAPACWHTRRDGLAEFAGLLSLITGSLGKMGQDVALMALQGIDEITLTGGGSSSAMPHKQNPILAELLVTLARFNATQLSGLHQALVHEQERSGSAWALEWMLLPPMAVATARALAAALDICDRVTRIGPGRTDC